MDCPCHPLEAEFEPLPGVSACPGNCKLTGRSSPSVPLNHSTVTDTLSTLCHHISGHFVLNVSCVCFCVGRSLWAQIIFCMPCCQRNFPLRRIKPWIWAWLHRAPVLCCNSRLYNQHDTVYKSRHVGTVQLEVTLTKAYVSFSRVSN